MKNFLLFCFLSFGSLIIKCQNIRVAHHSYVDEISNLVSIGTRHFYTERILYASFADSSNLVGLNSAGKIIFKKNFSFNESNYISKAIKTLDNCILVLGGANGCDFDNNPTNFIFKIDTNGVTKFQTMVPITGSGGLGDFVQHTDSSYYFISDSALIHYSKNGQFVSKSPTGIAFPNAIALNNAGNILINGNSPNFVTKNALVNTSGTLLAQQNSNGYKMIVPHLPSGNFYGLTWNGTIEKINSSLLVTNSTSATLSSSLEIRAFTIKNDSILFAGRMTTNNAAVYGILNQNLNQLYITQPVYKNVFPSGITFNGQNKVNIIANATSSTTYTAFNPIAFISFYQFPLYGNFLSTPDVGVQNISANNAVFYPGQGYCMVSCNVTVKNYSNDTIRNFYLNSPAEQLTCGYYQFHQYFSTTILPNSSVVVTTGDFLPSYYVTGSNIPGSTFTLNVCLFTTAPNQEPDIEINNDRGCKTILVTVTGIEENNLESSAARVYPNPFNTKFTVDSDEEIERVLLYNATGACIKEAKVNSKSFALENSDLPAGMYLVKIVTSKGTIIKKLLKE